MNFIKKWILNTSRQAWKEEIAANEFANEVKRTDKLHDMLSHNMAALVAFRINNGYLVRVMNPEDELKGRMHAGFTYCADHQAIADHLIASSARDKLGIQQELFQTETSNQVDLGKLIRKNIVSSPQPHGY